MKPFRKYLVTAVSIASLAIIGAGAFFALRSPLFTVQVVEVADQPEQAPLDAQTISDLAAVPVGKVGLFELDLAAVEKRLLSNEWIDEVRLTKRFPQTLSIAVKFREPHAILQKSGGSLSYVSAEGKVFGQVLLNYRPDLPILLGINPEQEIQKIHEALQLMNTWETSTLGRSAQLASLEWTDERGFRALALYPIRKGQGRTMVDLGESIDPDLSNVFKYLSEKSIAAHQIWADAGKKIVVKTAHGS